MKRYIIRFTAKVMLIVLTLQLVLPATSSFALTTGPSQPEVQSFEPVGTTEMVDLFSGDFVYNIPLMDIEGYPINISYHSGINMEQEASWVGLGWNINPGEINRNVRGLPDDFNGEQVSKILKIKDEKEWRLKAGIDFKPEVFGLAKIGASVGIGISNNNYKGMSAMLDFDVSAGLNFPYCSPQLGMGVSIGSQEGASIDASASMKFGTNRDMEESNGTLSFSGSTGFNTRSGLRNVGLGTSLGLMAEHNGHKAQGVSTVSTSIPIGLQNYVPVVTNSSTMNSFSFAVKVGPEAVGVFAGVGASLYWSNLSYDPIGSRNAYGYLYAQNANENAIMDFSREKDGMYNNTMPNLPLSSMTYDVYSISGQGGGGMCRPFRNDIGSVFDPVTGSHSSNPSFSVEGGLGAAYEFGGNFSNYENTIKSGPWFRRPFYPKSLNNLFENVFFKQAGEMTYSLAQDNPNFSSHNPITVDAGNRLRAKGGADVGGVPEPFGKTATGDRTSRSSLLSFLINNELVTPGIGNMAQIEDYNGVGLFAPCLRRNRPDYTTTTGVDKAKAHHIGEMTQTLPDGRRYVYSIPAMNNIQKEVTFAVDNNTNQLDIDAGLVAIGTAPSSGAADDSRGNLKGSDNYYQATYTPAYAHSYLLTSVLSPDYMDITGDGLSEDDLGSYTKINYARTDADFRWIAPIQAAGSEFSSTDKAQFNPGFWSDLKDDKANYIVGSKEVWYMHTIESKNMVAEFYITKRNDGMGVRKKITNASDNPNVGLPATYANDKTQSSFSYKLDSIKLYNKHDRILNQNTNAVPIKTVIFKYDYSLCQDVPNRASNDPQYSGGGLGDRGKLTLKRIYFRYGNSEKSLLNPYEFTYSANNNSGYNFARKDRWGNYKPQDQDITSYEFPYVKQDKTEADANASNWHLTAIKLPSGGNLSINYEADDYSYVQDKRSMEMFKVLGVGSSPFYAPKDYLYENLDNQYKYIYFKRNQNREIQGSGIQETLKKNYLDNENTLYFSFDVDLANKNRLEHITGYADVEEIGLCEGNNSYDDYAYVKVKLEKGGVKGNQLLNPMTLASLNKGRYYLPQIMYKGYSEGSVLGILKAMGAAAGELITIAKDANERFIDQKFAKRFVPKKSWIRFTTPGYTKIGGGTRVKSLEVSDNWEGMTGVSGSNAKYGQQYFYKTLLDNNQEISSGVASYEPLIGADEIPQHRPANKYTADGGRLLPPIEFNQEEPFGESFYPGATVGYSRVTVASINVDKARSAQSLNVHEFYTAKDFPVQTDFTEKTVPVEKHSKTHSSRFDEVNVLQGYALILNDMHGKPKAVTNYVIKTKPTERELLQNYTKINEAPKELVTSTKYNYQTQNGKLYNKVKAVKRMSLVSPNYYVTDMVLGEETDFTIDNRMRDMDSKSMNVTANINAIGLALFVIPIPTVFFPDSHERNVFKTMVATKVIQQYGILKSVETVDHGARVLSENMLFDSETGQPILTTVNNEYNDPISNASFPAYWAYDNMGGAYFNTGYEEIMDSVYIDNTGKGYLIGADKKRNFNAGDELLIKLGNYNYKVWITDMKPPPLKPLPYNPCPCGNLSESSTFVSVSNDDYCDGTVWCRISTLLSNNSKTYYVRNGSTWVQVSDLSGHPRPTVLPQPTTPQGYSLDFDNCRSQWFYTANTGKFYWTGQWIGPYGEDGYVAPPPFNCNAAVPVIEPRAKYPEGGSVKWTTFNQGYKNVYLKVIRSGRRNQLSSMVQNMSIKGTVNPVTFLTAMLMDNVPNVLSASANTYTENATDKEFTDDARFGFNDFILGKKGNFRDYESFTWLANRNYTNTHNRVNGTYNLNRFWISAMDFTACNFNDIAIKQDNNGSSLWRLLKKVTQYSAYGLPLEEQNASGIYSTALYGYNHSLPVAVGSNIKNNRLKYLNFEDLLFVNARNDSKLGIPEILTPAGLPAALNYHGLSYTSYAVNNFGTGMVLVKEMGHTGKYSLQFTSNNKIKLANISDYETTGDNRFCYVSMWVKPVSGTISTSGIYLRGYGKPGNPTASTDFTAFSIKTNSIDGWFKLEGKIDMGLLALFNEVDLVMPAQNYVDDIRLYPDNGNMKSFAYDMTNMRLMAELDENNFATFYEYDQEGVLIRVKKESDRGVLTVSENRKSNAK